MIKKTILLTILALALVLPVSSILLMGENGAANAKPETDLADRPLMSLRDLNNAFVDLAEAVNPAVVTVFTEKTFRVRQNPSLFGSPFGGLFGNRFRDRRGQALEREYTQQGLGSGVIVAEDGLIITNNHVVAEADTINVRLIDGRTLPAEIVGADAKTDIAVLRVDADRLPALKIGDSGELRVGEMVLAIGSPLSPNLAHTVTSGIVSAKGRSNVGLAEYEDFIQTDAAINPGNSGGALINLDGELIGINTAIASRSGGNQGIGFAVPSNMAKHVMDSLLEHGSVVRGWLGVYIQDIDEALAAAMGLEETRGVLISDLAEDGPAEEAGIEQGDIVIAVDGQKIEDGTQLRNDIALRLPGTKVAIDLIRDGREKRIKVKLAELPVDEVAADVEDKLEERFGFSVTPFSDELASKYRLNRSLEGLVITAVEEGGPAARAGLREGDLIVEANRKAIESLESFNDQMRGLDDDTAILFRVVRQNRSFYIGFRP